MHCWGWGVRGNALTNVCEFAMQAGVPRRPQEQHRDQAFGLAVPALLPGWDPGSCGDQGIGRGSWPLTLMIGIGWLYLGFHCLAGGFYVIWI